MSYVKPTMRFAEVPPKTMGWVGLLLRARLARGNNHWGFRLGKSITVVENL
jgi:hypothetical protein